jgi:colanic acid/amylovoran biosynthesis protein
VNRILIINQAWSNHGDEAAHKALVRMLAKQYPNAEISVLVPLLPNLNPSDFELFRPEELNQIIYIEIPADAWFYRAITCIKNLPLFSMYFMMVPKSGFKKLIRIIGDADLVIGAPGGVDLGPYRSWPHLLRLIIALRAGKPTAIYSPSIGPLPNDTWEDHRFTMLAKHVLKKVKFLSLRDDKSQMYAQEIPVDYIPSSDTAFLDDTACPIPSELLHYLSKPYAVFVPNAVFKWHPNFRSYPKELFENLYRQIMSTLLESGLHIIMLPQLFGSQNDENYFQELSLGFSQSAITVIPDRYPCEVQQAIIRKAEILVGARYHSIIFSIKNHIPFVALSYEHKISNMLTVAGLEDLMYDLQGIDSLDQASACEKILFVLQNINTIRPRVTSGNVKVLELARRTAEEFATRFPLK